MTDYSHAKYKMENIVAKGYLIFYEFPSIQSTTIFVVGKGLVYKSSYFFLIQMLFKLRGVNGRCFAIQGAPMLKRNACETMRGLFFCEALVSPSEVGNKRSILQPLIKLLSSSSFRALRKLKAMLMWTFEPFSS